MLGKSGKKTPLGKVIDLSITLFLVAAILYLAGDMLRSGRFTFLKFTPLSMTVGECRLSPVPERVIKAWRVLVRNSKKSRWQKVMEEGGGNPAVELEVSGAQGKVELSVFAVTRGAYFVARKGGKRLVFQVDSWTYSKFMEALEEGCRGGSNGG